MAGYNYTQYVQTIANLMPKSPTDPDFVVMLPNAIDYAEQRIYRELDMQITTLLNVTGTLTPNQKFYAVPATGGFKFITVKQASVLTPVGGASAASAYNVLTPVSLDVLNSLWPTNTAPSSPSIPTMYCPGVFNGDQELQATMYVAPPPDAAYTMACFCTFRPAALSATNVTTILTLNLPDLFLAASMVFVSGWMKDYGSQGDDPQLAQSWETQYQKLFASAATEEGRKKYSGQNWTSLSVSPQATPPRT